MQERIQIADVKSHAIRSVKWSSLAEVSSRSISPLVALILARILSPMDFGLIAFAIIVIEFARMFQDFGLGKTIIQRDSEIEECANVVFWINIVLSVFLSLALILGAPVICRLFREPRLVNLIRVLSLQIIFLGLSSVHQALFSREFQFRKLFFVRISSATVPGLVSIPLALLGYGVWSLVFGTLMGSFAQMSLLWAFSQWRPKFGFDIRVAKGLVKFGSWVTSEMLLRWVIVSGTQAILGYLLGIEELGIYRVGIAFVTLVFGVLLAPLVPVAYSSFSRLQSDREQLKRTYLRAIQLIRPISLPIGVGLFVLSEPISLTLFGDKWQGLEIIISVFGLCHGLVWSFTALNYDLYRAIGRPDLNSKILFVTTIACILSYSLAASYGLFAVCASRLVLVVISIPLHMLLVSKRLPLQSPYKQLSISIKSPSIASFFMGIWVFALSKLVGGIDSKWELSYVITTGVAVYVICLWIIDRRILRDVSNIAVRCLRERQSTAN